LRAPESPGSCIVRVRRQLWRVEGVKGEVQAAGAEFGVEGAVGSRADAAEAGRPRRCGDMPARSVGGGAACGKRSGAREEKRHGEEEGVRIVTHETFRAVGRRAGESFIVRSRHPKFGP
jgi:hypothetical protein